MIKETGSLVDRWIKYCDSNGIQPEGAAARIGVPLEEYKTYLRGTRPIPMIKQSLMQSIVEHRDLILSTVIKTKLFKELELFFKEALDNKTLITASAPTGQGKTFSAKYLATKHNAKYYHVLAEMQKEKKASTKNFVKDLSLSCGVGPRGMNSERFMIEKLRADTRSILIIDEAQRLITEDWGYFKVIQDIYDNVPNLSIVLIGNFKFYDAMYFASERTMTGILDEEQFLRRISTVAKLSRLSTSDVKLWCEYHGIVFNDTSDYKNLADFFKVRAGISDLEMIRIEIVKNILGRGRNELSEISYNDFVTVYKKLHTHIKFKDESETYELEEVKSA